MANSNKRATASKNENGGRDASGRFQSGSQAAREAGKKGAANQPTEAKREGGKHSGNNR